MLHGHMEVKIWLHGQLFVMSTNLLSFLWMFVVLGGDSKEMRVHVHCVLLSIGTRVAANYKVHHRIPCVAW